MTENRFEKYSLPQVNTELQRMPLPTVHALWDEADDKEGMTRSGYTQGEIYAEIVRREKESLKSDIQTQGINTRRVLAGTDFDPRFFSPTTPAEIQKANKDVS